MNEVRWITGADWKRSVDTSPSIKHVKKAAVTEFGERTEVMVVIHKVVHHLFKYRVEEHSSPEIR